MKLTKIVLSTEHGRVEFDSSLLVGRTELEPLGPDVKYIARQQFALTKRGELWHCDPRTSGHDTLHNKKKVTESIELKSGDELSIGDAEKGIFVMPMSVEICDA